MTSSLVQKQPVYAAANSKDSGDIFEASALANPGYFTKTSPANAATKQPTNPTLSWTASSNADYYEYCIDTTNDNDCTTSWISTGSNLNVPLSGLTPGTTYYWQVRATNATGTTYCGSGSASWRYFSVLPLPGYFAKTSPANGATYQPTNPSLSWGASSNADYYEYCIDTTNDNDCTTSWISTGSNLNVPLSGLTPGTTYYWQVRATNATGTTYCGSGSASWRYFSVLPLPGYFAKTSPANGATYQPTNPSLSWGASSNADYYEYCIDTTKDNACSASWISTGTNLNVALSGLTPGVKYSWQVRATNAMGTTYSGGSSTAWRYFTIGNKYYVATNGNDANPGTQSQPWKTIKKATNTMVAGDTALVLSGTYNEQVNITASGITLQAEGKVITKGIYISGNINTIRGFTITDPTSDWGIRTSGNNNLIEGNEIYHTKQDGIWFFGSYNTFRGNYIHDILDPSMPDTHVDCFQTWGWDWDTTNVLFEKNICIHNRLSSGNTIVMLERSTTSEVRDITFRNNIFVIYNPIYSSFIFIRPIGQPEISNITVVNNTIVNLSGAEKNGIEFNNITNALVANNLFINYGDKDNYIPYMQVYRSTNINIHNNAVYNTNGIPPYGVPYPGDIWMQDPMIFSLSGLDFHLQSNSPLIDAGYNLGNLVTNDFDGIIRPWGAGYDIGAYEFSSP